MSSLVPKYVLYRHEVTGKRELHGIEILSFGNAKMKYINVCSSKSRWEKRGYSSSYVYFRSYGHKNVKNDSFYVLSAKCSKKSVPVSARYLDPTEKSCLTLLENTADHGVLSYR